MLAMNAATQFSAARLYEPDLRFQAMFEGAAIGIAICQLDGRILEANPALGGMLGYSPQELTGAHAGELLPGLHPELHREIGGEVDPADFSRNADANFNSNANSNADSNERSLGELMRGERGFFEIEKRYQRKDGSQLWGHLTVSLGRDPRRQPAFLIAMLADATERKRAEEHLREAEKIEAIGRLAGGIAHDFNNLLTGILLYCDLLIAGLKNAGLEDGKSVALGNNDLENNRWQPGELCQHVEEVRLAGEQGAALTQQLLAIARKQAAEPSPVLINQVVASTKNLLQRLIGEQIELDVVLDDTLDPGLDPRPDSTAGRVLADPAQLRQILLNLVLNARDAMPLGGKIRLSTRAAEFPSRETRGTATRGDAEPKCRCRAVALAVKDNGCGMDAETRARLFEPFFTTKNPGEGTGLGLATVERIVSEAGGRIQVESEPGRGTSIEVFFPAIEASAGESSIKPSSTGESSNPASPQVVQLFASEAVPETERKTILLVDDHPAARKSMQRFLLDAGYRILAASNGKEALNVFAEDSAADLLIADCRMPRMTGQELAETLLRQKPDLKVLLISGYQDAPVGLAAGAVAMIRKPFSGRTLIERVVEVMQS
ncbi:MAG: ATP-binding protein [Terriglobales bacterium]|jgi:two-component system cell cycle sensor histidine kinase/response regulator CckA